MEPGGDLGSRRVPSFPLLGLMIGVWRYSPFRRYRRAMA